MIFHMCKPCLELSIPNLNDPISLLFFQVHGTKPQLIVWILSYVVIAGTWINRCLEPR